MSLDSPHDTLPDPAREPRFSRTKKLLWAAAAIAVVLVLGLIVHARIASQRGPGAAGGGGFRPGGGFGGPLAVGVAQATAGDVPITIDSLGTVTPLATVTVHPQVTGPLVKITFNEGQLVKAGDLLAEIDPRPFQAALDQAQAQLQHDQALLANARVDLDRYKTLMAQNSVAEQTYATQQATVLQDEATVVADQATVETARLNLSYCRIVSPVAGSVGLRQVDNGNVVSAYSSSIVVVTQLQPMSVLFTIPEDSLNEVLHRMHGGDRLSVVAFDRTFTTQLDSGELSNSDNEVDTTTGTLKLRAMFNNKDLELFPNQFVNVRLTLDVLHNQILVPGSAVQSGSGGNYVYVVDLSDDAADPPTSATAGPQNGSNVAAAKAPGQFGRRGTRGGKGKAGAFGPVTGPVRIVHVRYVKTGPAVGSMASIQQGLQSGETVVIDGAEQLRDGASVTVPSNDSSGLPDGAALGSGGGPASASGDAGSNSGAGTPTANTESSSSPAGPQHGAGRRGGKRGSYRRSGQSGNANASGEGAQASPAQ